jgi:two-component system, OmpR family, catabolic regulation response regulator CreB
MFHFSFRIRIMSHILIVEDELAIAEAIQLALAKAGHSADFLAFGQAALNGLLSDGAATGADPHHGPSPAYELVILDVGLPDLSGFEVCRQIRLRYSPPELPILFLTAHSEEIDRVLGLELSGGDYLTKPFSLRELVTRVRLLLGRRAPRENTPLQGLALKSSDLPDLNFDSSRRYLQFEWNEQEAWVTYRSQKLVLTITEFRLLTVFLARPRQVFSRQQLLDQSRGETHPSGERTIDTHIKSLRAKLRAISAEADIISTHRGLGYSSL